ncbi:hypothetical protein MAR_002415 [Mya arenaria]|uniref:B box-type domain-containing protein n=1 Tax=Mya arenaria TaxID=6604 RepID=A0ABY7FHR4_MYAAR|nr:uncharacterized protein LOC128207607 [Mya arenaria]WAR20577.1 hypothetical protein MAR_002415 [Mya arenaria]
MATGLSVSEVLNAGDLKYDLPCTECQEHGLNSEAVYFCQHCSRQLCGLCLKRHDRFYRRHTVLGPEKMNSWGKVKNTCKIHPGDEMVVFCRDHWQTCCVTCRNELHRKCKRVIRLQHMVRSSKTAKASTQPEGKYRARTNEHAKTLVVTYMIPDKPYTVIKSKCFGVRLANDNHRCSIQGMAALPGGEIIITDYSNRKLKLLSTDYIVVDHVRVSKKQLGICVVSDNQVAVCTGDFEIQFFHVRNSKLGIDRKLKMDHECRWVAYREGYLYVSSPDTVYQYTLSGQRVRKLYTTCGGYLWGIAMSSDGDRIYLTNGLDNQLVTVDLQGRVVATIDDRDMDRTRGVCVSNSGQVFVCGYISNTIQQVASEGKHKLTTLATETDGVCRPQSVCYDSRTSCLIVGQAYSCHIVVLKLK